MDKVTTGQFVEYFSPKPSPFKLRRFGGRRDGAYLLPDDLEGVVACFSPGVENRKRFEDELLKDFGIRSHLADFSSDESKFTTPLDPGHQTFVKKWLGAVEGEDTITLDDWVDEMEPLPSGDLLLQMDIEGGEDDVFETVSETTLKRFRVIVVELHGIPGKLGLNGVPQNHPIGQRKWPLAGRGLKFIEKLSPLFTVIHARPNNCSAVFRSDDSSLEIPNVMEFTLIRNDRFLLRQDLRMLPPCLPHPKDIVSNCRGKQPIFLGSEWLVEKRPFISKIKILWAFCVYLAIFPLALTKKIWVRRRVEGI